MDPLREALQHIKKMVCGDALPRWVVDPQVTATRMQIADICDAALQQAPAQEPVAYTNLQELDWARRNPGRAGHFYCTPNMPSDIKLYTHHNPKCYTSN